MGIECEDLPYESMRPMVPQWKSEGVSEIRTCLDTIKDLENPIPLIHIDRNNGREYLKIDDNAREWLESTGNKRVTVICITGPYRSGKSFLLNQLLEASPPRNKTGFDVGSTIRACTEGVWMWGVSNTPEAYHLVLDFEGLSDLLRNPERDSRLLSLALLVSDYLIFNTKGVLDETAIQSISAMSHLADHVRRLHPPTRSETSRVDIEGDVKTSVPLPSDILGHQHWVPPALLWVLRDFCLKLEDVHGNPITTNEYLERVLEASSRNTSAKVHDTRSDIRSFFSYRECVTLIQPVIDEQKLWGLASMTDNQMREPFRRQVHELRKKVLFDSSVVSKSRFTMSGRGFIRLLDRYVNRLNDGQLPEVHWTWAAVQNEECEDACAKAYSHHLSQITGEIRPNMPMKPSQLTPHLERLKVEASNAYKKYAVGDRNVVAEKYQKLLGLIERTESDIIKTNLILSDERASALMDELTAPVDIKISTSAYDDRASLQSDITKITKRFNDEAPLDEAHRRAVVAERTTAVYYRGLSALMDKQRRDLEAQLTEAQQAVSVARMEMAEGDSSSSDTEGGGRVLVHSSDSMRDRQKELEDELERLKGIIGGMEPSEDNKLEIADLHRRLSIKKEENHRLEELLRTTIKQNCEVRDRMQNLEEVVADAERQQRLKAKEAAKPVEEEEEDGMCSWCFPRRKVRQDRRASRNKGQPMSPKSPK
eukprot:GHVO01065100.1.p1 GENE.GHVO01065100.1~~GHVO01065100.1.p1  ORF type:complete len:709 (+),score=160.47 GHVO01065100.1:71-2197(+)